MPLPSLRTALVLALAVSAGAGRAAESAPPDLAALDQAFGHALSTYQGGDYEGAVRELEALLGELERRPASAEAEAQWSRALLRLAHARATLGRTDASREAMEALLALEPDAKPDPELYSPSFRREFERARARVGERPRWRLTVASRGGGPAAAAVGCRLLGDAPAAVELPAGRYRVSVASGGGSATATVELAGDRTVELEAPGAAAAPSGEARAAKGDEAVPPVDLGPAPAGNPEPRASLADAVAPAPVRWEKPAALALASGALAAAGVAVWQGVEAGQAASEARSLVASGGSLAPGASPASYAAAAASFASDRRNAWIAAGASLALGAAAALLLAWPEDGRVAPSPTGAVIHF